MPAAALPSLPALADAEVAGSIGITLRAVGQLYVLRKGVCVKNWNFMRGGAVWGDDMIIDALHLLDHSQAVAVTYMEGKH